MFLLTLLRQSTHVIRSRYFRKSCCLRDNYGKCGRTLHIVDDQMSYGVNKVKIRSNPVIIASVMSDLGNIG